MSESVRALLAQWRAQAKALRTPDDGTQSWHNEQGHADGLEEAAAELEAALNPLADLEAELRRFAEAQAEIVASCEWAERHFKALVTEDEGHGSFIRGTGTELVGFSIGRDKLREVIRTARKQYDQALAWAARIKESTVIQNDPRQSLDTLPKGV